MQLLLFQPANTPLNNGIHQAQVSLNNFIFSESQATILPLRLLARQLSTPRRPNHLGPRPSLVLDLVCPTHLAARPLIFLEIKENKITYHSSLIIARIHIMWHRQDTRDRCHMIESIFSVRIRMVEHFD